MASPMCEFDQELGTALSTANGIIDLLDCGNEREAFRELAGLVETLRVLCRMKVYSPEIPLPDNFERAMSLVTSAQESRSWLLLGDVLKYEIKPILKNWKAIMRQDLPVDGAE